ncbi:MAG: amidohydrolase family protein [Proteobacteria bacterium]|nr:amidohydrolase family protein [Pseudomonadota bacterium]
MISRRDFLYYSALTSLAAVCPSLLAGCTTKRYKKPQSLTQPYEKLLLTNANIFDVYSGTFFDETQLLIQHGRIVDIFHANSSGITPDYTLDLNGAYILPGFINSHCHLSAPGGFPFPGRGALYDYLVRQSERNAEECVKHGVTTVRDMMAFLNLRDQLEKNIERRKVVGPRMINSFALEVNFGYLNASLVFEPLRSAGIGTNHTTKIVNTPEDGRIGVQVGVDNGADFIKIAHQEKTLVRPLPNPRAMEYAIAEAICDEAAKFGKIVAIHHTCTKGLRIGLDAGATTFEHMACDRVLMDSEIQEIIDKGKYIIPTASVGYAIDWETPGDEGWDEGFKADIVNIRAEIIPKYLREFLEPLLLQETLKTYQKYTHPEYFNSLESIVGVEVKSTDTICTYGLKNYQALYEAGVKLGCGNDGGVPLLPPGHMALELYLGERINIDKADLLKMITINNAEIIGMKDELGSIEAGKIADLVIFENNPLDTLKNTFNPIYVFQNGDLSFKA